MVKFLMRTANNYEWLLVLLVRNILVVLDKIGSIK